MSSTLRRLAAVLLTIGLVTGLMVATGPGTAQAATRGFWIHNYTTKSMVLTSKQGVDDPAHYYYLFNNYEVPPVGALIPPGQMMHLELDYGYRKKNELHLTFDTVHDGWLIGSAFIALTVGGDEFKTRSSRGRYGSNVGPPILRVVSHSQDVYLYEPPGEIDASTVSLDAQSSFVGNMCDNGDARCGFTVTANGVPTGSHEIDITRPEANFTCDPITKKYTLIDKRRATTSWGVEVSAKGGVKDSWEVGMKAWTSGSYTNEWSYNDEKTLTVKPAYRLRVLSTVPVLRYAGVFTVLTNEEPQTKWSFRTAVDTPYPADSMPLGNGKTLRFEFRDIATPISPAELAERDWDCPKPATADDDADSATEVPPADDDADSATDVPPATDAHEAPVDTTATAAVPDDSSATEDSIVDG